MKAKRCWRPLAPSCAAKRAVGEAVQVPEATAPAARQTRGRALHLRVDASRGPTLRDLADKWLKLHRASPKLSDGPLKHDGTNMKRHILPVFGDTAFADLGTGNPRAFVRSLRDKRRTTRSKKPSGRRLSPSSVCNIVNTLAAFVGDAMARSTRRVPSIPCSPIWRACDRRTSHVRCVPIP
jgi:hypothetical protein